jgi:hypothetical protein
LAGKNGSIFLKNFLKIEEEKDFSSTWMERVMFFWSRRIECSK